MDDTKSGYLDLRETHCAGVVLVGDRAYKFKKPVSFGFLDFTTEAARRRACEQEIRLNARFAPDVYLGLGQLCLPGDQREPLVVMRRMPEDLRLSTMVRRGANVSEALRALARQLAIVHARSEHRPEIDAAAGLDGLRRRWSANLAESAPFAPSVLSREVLDEVGSLTRRFLAGRQSLFDRRLAQGCSVDGHGDLTAEDVFCLDDGPRALDCLEFDSQLRFVDRLDDAAFLCMDLERLGAADLAALFMHWYAEFSGDAAPPSLRHHYVAYRAFVRAKVSCLACSQGSATAASNARHLVELARRHLSAGRVTLTLVGGLPGTGKTTLARALADRIGAVVISSDRLRKELAGVDPLRSAAASYGKGIYTGGHTERTYQELLHQARVLLGLGESVVLDASWSSVEHRERARSVAYDCLADLTEVCCSAVPALVAQRLSLRSAQRHLAGDHSDADAGIAAVMSNHFEDWPQAMTLDTVDAPEALAERVAQLVLPVPRTYAPSPRHSLMSPD